MAGFAQWLARIGAAALGWFASGFLIGPHGPDLAPAQLVVGGVFGGLAVALGAWSFRPSTSTLSSFGRVALKLVGTVFIAYGLAEVAIASLLRGSPEGVASGLPFLLIGAALWAMAVWSKPEIPPMRPPGPIGIAAAAGAVAAALPPLEAERLDRLADQVEGEAHAAFHSFWEQSLRVALAVTLTVVAVPVVLGLLLVSRGPAAALGAVAVGVPALLLALIAIWTLQLFTFGGLRRELAAGRIPADFRYGFPIRNFQRQLREARSPESPPPAEASDPSLAIGRIIDGLRFGRKVTNWRRDWAVLTVVVGTLIAVVAAYATTFSLLLHYAGGTSLLPRDGGIATLVALAVATIAFPLLYRAYRRIDTVERRFVEHERALADLEQAFWARY